MMKELLSFSFCVLGLGCCDEDRFPTAGEWTPLVNIQVTETSNPEAFERIVSELQVRGIKATILVDADFASQNCDTLRSLASEGFEIMAFARPEYEEGGVVTLSMLSHEEQESLISGVKTAIENCLGKTIQGFRCYRFDQNEDTYQIVDGLGFAFNLGFVAHTGCSFPGHGNDILPYRAPGYDFWAVPMHSVYSNNRWAAFCDMPFRSLEGAEWEALLQSEFDNMRSQGRPLLVEVHPYFSGVDDGRFEAFVNFLDYAQGHGARFLTVAELVEWSESQGTSGLQGTVGPCFCGE